ncbi:MAG: dihydropteroate synthase [Saprospiraceae bacterium]|nr:dihydropteroate synthase [Saprospiraceae bacterium]
MFWQQTTLNCRGTLLDLINPIVMGIINATPDSFYTGSRSQFVEESTIKVAQMIEDGAAIIDIGGMSTRPGALAISPKEEILRLKPVIEAIRKTFPNQVISVDTIWGEVARWALDEGVHMINDISGWTIDPSLLDVVSSYRVPYVLMHMKGTPTTMQREANYDDIVLEVLDFLIAKLGVLVERDVMDVIIDPGFGFAKNAEHNFELLQNLHVLKILDRPIMAGLSRKSTIQKTLGVDAEHALNGTTALHMVALQQGAQILRVHDVKEAMECIKLHSQLKLFDRSNWSVKDDDTE